MRDESLSETIFYDLDHARSALARWAAGYNLQRPRSALGYLTPATFAGNFRATPTRSSRNAERAGGLPLR
jgi:transposase InsO family protein